jgi:hypothetical protein
MGFCPLFIFSAHFLCEQIVNNPRFSAHLPTFCPLFLKKWAREKPHGYAGLRVLCPLSHFFSLLHYMLKMNKIYIISKKKWASGQTAIRLHI